MTSAIPAKAFCGGLVPTEANLTHQEDRLYESAVELLARIRAERSRSESKPGSPRSRTREPLKKASP